MPSRQVLAVERVDQRGFLHLPGNGTDIGHPAPYRLVAVARHIASVPTHSCVNDHDTNFGSLTKYYTALGPLLLAVEMRGVPYCFYGLP